MQDSFPCTPEGNCFAVIEDHIGAFDLKMAGPTGAVFHPESIFVPKESTCTDISFILQGFELKMAVRTLQADGNSSDGPEGLTLNLGDYVAKTDPRGYATFPEV